MVKKTAAQKIDGATRLCAVLLHPAAHTRSPAMHNAAFKAHGLNALYFACDVPPSALPAAIEGAGALGFAQLAISLPHKQAVMPLLGEVEPTARRIGAVNTVTRAGERWVGANTDWLGLVRALERETTLKGRRAVVLGAGGTARAAVFGLRERGARVSVLNRSAGKAAALARELGAEHHGALDELGALSYDLLVNTTSAGLGGSAPPVPEAALHPNTVVFDAVYEPAETALLQNARAKGARTIGGKWMLVHQAAEQLRLWAGIEPDIETLARAFDTAQPAGLR